MPPVKLACLACRASRVRCDGVQPCYNCISRDQECFYQPSRRGGSRKTSTRKSAIDQLSTASPCRVKHHDQIQHLLAPGAGLRRLDEPPNTLPSIQPEATCALRIYNDNESLLNAYYLYIHPFFPVLPPPCAVVGADTPVFWNPADKSDLPLRGQKSPLVLALSLILVHVKLPNCDGGSHQQQLFPSLRTRAAQEISRKAVEQIELDTEYEDYCYTGESSPLLQRVSSARSAFHPLVPVELETIIALLVLSNYEHMQKGNLSKMTSRISQALILAKSLSLHQLPLIEDELSEARRRTWWMAYAYGKLCSLVCRDIFAGLGEERNVTTPYPQLESDSEAWRIYIEALRLSVSANNLATTQRAVADVGGDMRSIYLQASHLETEIHQLVCRLDATATNTSSQGENICAQIMRRLSRIKLASARIRYHRQYAFADIPIFTKGTCDTTSANRVPNDDSTIGLELTPNNQFELMLFDCTNSATICTDAALVVARQLQYLSNVKDSVSQMDLPCTMPVSTCCAMQASHALLMQLYNVGFLPQDPIGDLQLGTSSERLEHELRHGLQDIITSLGKQADLYDAVGGMKEEVEAAFQLAS